VSNPVTDLSTLRTAVSTWLARADLTAVVDYFIFFAEKELNRTKRIFAQETVQYVDTVAGSKWVPYPSGYKGFRWLRRNIGTEGGRLTFMTADGIHAQSKYLQAGTPEVYCLHGDRIQLGPIPEGVIQLEAGVYEDIPYLSNTNTSNWWLANAPDALMYGALLHAEPYLKNDQRVGVWRDLYTRATETIDEADEHYRYPKGSLVQRTS